MISFFVDLFILSLLFYFGYVIWVIVFRFVFLPLKNEKGETNRFLKVSLSGFIAWSPKKKLLKNKCYNENREDFLQFPSYLKKGQKYKLKTHRSVIECLRSDDTIEIISEKSCRILKNINVNRYRKQMNFLSYLKEKGAEFEEMSKEPATVLRIKKIS